jgi:hypothetical protein
VLIRGTPSGERAALCRRYLPYLRALLHDTDIWPVQETFHLLQELRCEPGLATTDWMAELDAPQAPLLQGFSEWRMAECGWAEFESAASRARQREREGLALRS